jgi:hypothetical protein
MDTCIGILEWISDRVPQEFDVPSRFNLRDGPLVDLRLIPEVGLTPVDRAAISGPVPTGLWVALPLIYGSEVMM